MNIERWLDAAFWAPTPIHLLLALLCAAVLSGLLAFVYRIAAGAEYNSDIAKSQVLLSCIMAVVLMVVGDSLSRAFGAVGILSVIRFRAKISRASEAATLLSAVAVGMACGVGLMSLAAIGTLFLSLLLLTLSWWGPGSGKGVESD